MRTVSQIRPLVYSILIVGFVTRISQAQAGLLSCIGSCFGIRSNKIHILTTVSVSGGNAVFSRGEVGLSDVRSASSSSSSPNSNSNPISQPEPLPAQGRVIHILEPAKFALTVEPIPPDHARVNSIENDSVRQLSELEFVTSRVDFNNLKQAWKQTPNYIGSMNGSTGTLDGTDEAKNSAAALPQDHSHLIIPIPANCHTNRRVSTILDSNTAMTKQANQVQEVIHVMNLDEPQL